MSADKDMVSMALDLGVTGYILKESAARELVNAIREIASIMDVSVKTIEKHRQTIMDKLNIHNVIHLTRYAVEKKIVK